MSGRDSAGFPCALHGAGYLGRTSTSPTFKASLCRSRCLLKKSGLAPHDHTSEGSRALEDAAPATPFQQGWFQKTTWGQQTEGFSPTRATLAPQGAQRGPQRRKELEVTCSWLPRSAGWAEDRARHRGSPSPGWGAGLTPTLSDPIPQFLSNWFPVTG